MNTNRVSFLIFHRNLRYNKAIVVGIFLIINQSRFFK